MDGEEKELVLVGMRATGGRDRGRVCQGENKLKKTIPSTEKKETAAVQLAL